MITKEEIKYRLDLLFSNVSGIHLPCGMPHSPTEGCTKNVIAELVMNAYKLGKEEKNESK